MNINDLLKRSSMAYAAGSLGGICSFVTAWACGRYGLTTHFRVQIAPTFTIDSLFPHLVLSGIFGFPFMLPLGKNRSFLERAFVFSLVPALIQLLYVLPVVEHQGYFGF